LDYWYEPTASPDKLTNALIGYRKLLATETVAASSDRCRRTNFEELLVRSTGTTDRGTAAF